MKDKKRYKVFLQYDRNNASLAVYFYNNHSAYGIIYYSRNSIEESGLLFAIDTNIEQIKRARSKAKRNPYSYLNKNGFIFLNHTEDSLIRRTEGRVRVYKEERLSKLDRALIDIIIKERVQYYGSIKNILNERTKRTEELREENSQG